MSSKFIIIFTVILLKYSTGIPITGECTGNPPACPANNFCFKNTNKSSGCQKSCPKGWSCNNGDVLCNIPMEQMVKEVNELKHGDVISGFALNQLCIAKYGCENKQSLDNPSWFDDILNAFVVPYVEKNGNWTHVIDHCHAQFSKIPIVGKYLCQQKMAEYHITVDLKNAVNKNGCGTQHDWDIIGKFIVDCVKDANIGVPFGETYAISEVIRQRNIVRANCIKARKEYGLQMPF